MPLAENEVGAGCILTLTSKKSKLCSDSCALNPCPLYCKGCQQACGPPSKECHNPYCRLRKKAYGHPIVVLGVRYRSREDNTSETRITFAIISALPKMLTFENFLLKQKEFPKDFGDIVPCSFGPNGPQTPTESAHDLEYRIEPGQVNFTKRCYLLPHVYTLSIESFVPFWLTKKPYEFRFDENSYEKIMKRLNRSKDVFISTYDLWSGLDNSPYTRLASTHFTTADSTPPPFDEDRRLNPEARESAAIANSASNTVATASQSTASVSEPSPGALRTSTEATLPNILLLRLTLS